MIYIQVFLTDGIYIADLKLNFSFGIKLTNNWYLLGIYFYFFCIYLVSNRYQIDFRYLVGTLKRRQEDISKEVRCIIIILYLKSDFLDQKVQKDVSSLEKWKRPKGDCIQM